MLAIERRTQLLDAVDVHDRRPMDSDELLRIQVRLEMSHRFPHEMRLPTDVETYVVAGRLTPVDVGGRDEMHPATRLHHQAIPRWRLPPAHLGQQGH